MVSATLALRYVMSISRYQFRSSMYNRGLIPRNSKELAEAVPIGLFRDSNDMLFEMSPDKTHCNLTRLVWNCLIKLSKNWYFSVPH